MKSLKKPLVLALALALAFPVTLSLAGCGDRTQVLKIYNWGEYIADGSDDSKDVIADFEEWYEELTGDPVRVEYSLFDTNETMYTQVSNKHADYDVVCPSDYTVQKMMTNGLLLPVNDADFSDVWADVFSGEDPEIYGLEADEEITLKNIMNPGLTDLLTVYDEGWGADGGSVYSVPYVWGTFGLLYDDAKIVDLGGTAADMQSWEALFGDKYAGHIYMKNSVRDAYASANIYNKTDELKSLSADWTDYGAEYRDLLAQCMNHPNPDTISSAEATLKKQKKNLFAYESDEGKEDLMTGKSAAALGFVWSCDAGYVIGQEENTELWYSVPVEGTNVWVDNWCIPKYAGNKKAAQYFIAYCCTYDVAYENMYWVGAGTAVSQAALDITDEIRNPRELFISDYLGENAGAAEDDASAAWGALVADASDDKSPTAAESYDALAEYVYFLDKYLESADECANDAACGCDWHAYAKMYAECLLPAEDQVGRAAIMTDFAEKNTDIVRMFTRVKAA